MVPQNHLPLSRLAPELDALPGVTGRSPGYRKLHMMALDGRFRTELVNGRHYVRRADLQSIAQMVGMLPSPAIEPSRAGSITAAEHVTA